MTRPEQPTLATRHLSLATVLTVFLIALATCHPPLATAQSTDATITGIVTDPSKAIIRGARVDLINVDTGVRYPTVTNGSGIYSVSGQVGNYRIEVEHPGFRTVIAPGIVLHTQDALELNFEMAVGSTSESITVNANTTNDSPAVSTVVTQEFVENMPLNGRSFQDLIALTPGAVAAGSGYYSIDGQRDDANYFTVDGVSANTSANPKSSNGAAEFAGVYPAQTALGTTQSLASVDAMEEFRVETSGYTADHGRQPGGQVEITTRSGTNEYHGTAFDYLRNTVFDANNWFLNAAGIPRGADHQNDFGGTFGGPIDIPRLYRGKDRAFMFLNYEGLRLYLPQVDTEEVPTISVRQNAAPGVQPFLNTYPLPNGAASLDGLTALATNEYSEPNILDSGSARVDYSFGKELHLFSRFSNTHSLLNYAEQPATILENQSVNALEETVGSTWVVSPTKVNETRFNFSKTRGSFFDSQQSIGGGTPMPLSLFTEPASLAANDYTLNWAFSSGTSLDALGPQYTYSGRYPNFYNVVDSFALTHGTHSIKVGVDFRRISGMEHLGQNPRRSIVFDSVDEVDQGIAGETLFLATPELTAAFTNLSLYAMDHWKLGSHFSLDYGLRWDLNPPPTASGMQQLLALNSPVTNLNTATIAPLGTPVYHTEYTAFAPRLGFAWQLLSAKSHPVVVRVGSGIFYDTGQSQSAIDAGGRTLINYVVSTNVPLPFTGDALVPPPVSTSPVIPYLYPQLLEPNLRVPYTTQWNLAVDIGLAARNTATISYVGNEGKDLLFNAIYYDNIQNPDFALASLVSNAASSNYNALNLQDRGVIAPGLEIVGSYTWAHAIDNDSSDAAQSNAPIRGNSSVDIHQVFNVALNYEIPGSNAGQLAKALTKGWGFSNRFQAQTGYPFNVIQGYFDPVSSAGLSLQEIITPNFVTGVPVYLHGVHGSPGEWQLNPAAFSAVPLNPDGSPVSVGSVGVNALFGPSFWNLNTALQRSIGLSERLTLQGRIEAFNIFNHPNFTGIENYLGASNFGQATSLEGLGVPNNAYATGNPRSLQVSLKLLF